MRFHKRLAVSASSLRELLVLCTYRWATGIKAERRDKSASSELKHRPTGQLPLKPKRVKNHSLTSSELTHRLTGPGKSRHCSILCSSQNFRPLEVDLAELERLRPESWHFFQVISSTCCSALRCLRVTSRDTCSTLCHGWEIEQQNE